MLKTVTTSNNNSAQKQLGGGNKVSKACIIKPVHRANQSDSLRHMSDSKKAAMNLNIRKNVSIDLYSSDFKKVVASGRARKLTSPSAGYPEMNAYAQHQKSLSSVDQFNDVKLSGALARKATDNSELRMNSGSGHKMPKFKGDTEALVTSPENHSTNQGSHFRAAQKLKLTMPSSEHKQECLISIPAL